MEQQPKIKKVYSIFKGFRKGSFGETANIMTDGTVELYNENMSLGYFDQAFYSIVNQNNQDYINFFFAKRMGRWFLCDQSTYVTNTPAYTDIKFEDLSNEVLGVKNAFSAYGQKRDGYWTIFKYDRVAETFKPTKFEFKNEDAAKVAAQILNTTWIPQLKVEKHFFTKPNQPQEYYQSVLEHIGDYLKILEYAMRNREPQEFAYNEQMIDYINDTTEYIAEQIVYAQKNAGMDLSENQNTIVPNSYNLTPEDAAKNSIGDIKNILKNSDGGKN